MSNNVLASEMGGEIFFKYKDLLIQKMLEDEELTRVLMVGTKFPFLDTPKEDQEIGDLIGEQIFPVKYTPETPQEQKQTYITMDVSLVRGRTPQEVVAMVTLYVFAHKDLTMIYNKEGRMVARVDYLISRLYDIFDGEMSFGNSKLMFIETQPFFVQRDIVGTSITFAGTDFARQYN